MSASTPEYSLEEPTVKPTSRLSGTQLLDEMRFQLRATDERLEHQERHDERQVEGRRDNEQHDHEHCQGQRKVAPSD